MTPAERAQVCAELDRSGTPPDALAWRMLAADAPAADEALERARRSRLTNHELDLLDEDEAAGLEDRLALLGRGRGW